MKLLIRKKHARRKAKEETSEGVNVIELKQRTQRKRYECEGAKSVKMLQKKFQHFGAVKLGKNSDTNETVKERKEIKLMRKRLEIELER